MSAEVSRLSNGTAEGREFLPPAAPRAPWVTVLFIVVALAALAPLVLVAYYGTVQNNLAFTVSPAGLSVSLGVGRIDIPAEEIAAVTYVEDPPRMRRSRGAGLSGFQMGWYRLADYGPVYRLTTQSRPVVYVDTKPDAERARSDTRYVLNPEDAEKFVSLLESARAGASDAFGGEQVTFRAPTTRSVFADPLLIISVIISVPVAVALPIIIRKGRTSLTYRVGPEGISVRHFGTRRYRWDRVRSVRRIDEPFSRMWRLMGAALPGYYTGDFTSRELGAVKVYATRLQPPLVLLETRIGKVLLSPEDVDGFMDAVAEFRPENG